MSFVDHQPTSSATPAAASDWMGWFSWVYQKTVPQRNFKFMAKCSGDSVIWSARVRGEPRFHCIISICSSRANDFCWWKSANCLQKFISNWFQIQLGWDSASLSAREGNNKAVLKRFGWRFRKSEDDRRKACEFGGCHGSGWDYYKIAISVHNIHIFVISFVSRKAKLFSYSFDGHCPVPLLRKMLSMTAWVHGRQVAHQQIISLGVRFRSRSILWLTWLLSL